MKSLFDKDTHAEMLERLAKLTPECKREWGKMSPSQAMEHTARVLEMATSDEQPIKQIFLGKALAWIFKGQFLGEKPFRKNAPTGPDYVIADQPDFEATRARLKALIDKFNSMGEAKLDGNVHPFFGKLTGKQWGETQYKHVDHHLRQFGV
jgi:hypothetical protein